MNHSTQRSGESAYLGAAMEIAIRIGALALLILWCFQILRPFVSLVIWGIILAVAIYPACRRLSGLLNDRLKSAAALITTVALLVIVVPSIRLGGSLVDGMKHLNDVLQSSEMKVPPPPDRVDTWPVIGKPLKNLWHQASVNLKTTLTRFEPQLKAIGKRLLEAAIGSGLGFLKFAFSIIIAGILMAKANGGGRVARELFVRLAGERGADFADIATMTIRNVVKGILGVAIIQALLAGTGFVVAGVPGAGLWAFLCLLLAIIQIGIFPVVIPVVIYMFSSADTLTAGLLTAWLVVVSLLDNFLKPIFLGHGAPVPMLVIFLGAIGGFISMGFIGLFIGAVILSVGFKLLQAWLDDHAHPVPALGTPDAASSENREAAG